MGKHHVSVAAAVVREDGRILVIKRDDNGKWEPPGGQLELKETVEEGLKREVREETGLEVEIDNLSGVYKNMVRGVVALVFRCHVIEGTPKTTRETVGFAWMSAAEIREHVEEAYAVRLLDALEAMPAIRAHDGTRLLSQSL